MIKILWLLKSKINSDFINKISDELELKVQISSSFEKETIYDVIILENLAIISHLNEIQKNAIIIYVLDISFLICFSFFIFKIYILITIYVIYYYTKIYIKQFLKVKTIY